MLLPAAFGSCTQRIARATFRVGVGAAHPLAIAAGDGPVRVSVEEMLGHDFALPESALFASKAFERTPDGWRDDVYPRRAAWRTDSLHTLASLVRSGIGAAYLPRELCDAWGLKLVEITGCPFTCEADVFAVHARTQERGWMNQFLALALEP